MTKTTNSAITTEQIEHVAKLSRLRLTPSEIAAAATDMQRILAHVDKLAELDVSAVPGSAHGVSLEPRLRDDVVAAGLGLDKVMQNAPERLGDGFGVPKIIE
jgi:aspartyl-tRNA(Asn)/glutamyl-tRNA(Gln) amidotransferase subunit C